MAYQISKTNSEKKNKPTKKKHFWKRKQKKEPAPTEN